MAPKPSSAASRIVSRGKMCFSSHSAANGVIASAVNLRAISWIWSWSSVRSNWLIARRALARGFFLKQSLEPQHVAHRVPLEHPAAEGGEVGPAVEAAKHLF